jgi:hypothetical protein
MEQFPGTLRPGTEPGRQQDRTQVHVAAHDMFPDDQAMARVEPAGRRPARRAVMVELATQQLGPREHVRRLPDTQVAGLAGRVMTGSQKMGEATGGRDVARAGSQLVGKSDCFTFINQYVTEYTLQLSRSHASTARSDVGRETGSSPAA